MARLLAPASVSTLPSMNNGFPQVHAGGGLQFASAASIPKSASVLPRGFSVDDCPGALRPQMATTLSAATATRVDPFAGGKPLTMHSQKTLQGTDAVAPGSRPSTTRLTQVQATPSSVSRLALNSALAPSVPRVISLDESRITRGESNVPLAPSFPPRVVSVDERYISPSPLTVKGSSTTAPSTVAGAQYAGQVKLVATPLTAGKRASLGQDANGRLTAAAIPRVSVSGLQRSPNALGSGTSAASQAVQGATAHSDMQHLLLLLRNPNLLRQYAVKLFRKCDLDGNGVLSSEELLALIPALHKEFGLKVVEEPGELKAMVKSRMRKYDLNGDGVLSEQEFLELYRWTLWLKYEQLDRPVMKRSSLVGNVSKGTPSKIYAIGEKIGHGMFGVVNIAKHRELDCDRVMKTINKQMAVQAGTPMAMLNQEIEILALLDHPHILRLFEHYDDIHNIYIITDVCYGGHLLQIVEQHAEQRIPLPEAWVATVFRQAVEAIGYCHSKGVMHKDLKFENLMLHDPVDCKSPLEQIHVIVIDVGLSELFGPQHRKGVRSNLIAGSPATMAPEVIMQDFSFKCDIWSFGCLLYAIFNVQPAYLPDGAGGQVLYTYPFAPVPSETDRFGLQGMMQAQRLGPPMEQIQSVSPLAQEVVVAMLAFDESNRPSALESLQLPWFSGHCPPTAVELSGDQVEALLNDREVNMWRRTVTLEAATQLPVSAVWELEKEFESMAASTGGTAIDCAALAAALVQKGVAQDVAETVAEVADLDKSGRIEWTEFVAAMLPACHELFASVLQSIFQQHDTNHDGYLDSQEVAMMLRAGDIDSMHLPRGKTVEMMIQELDENKDGKISFEEFHHYLLTPSC